MATVARMQLDDGRPVEDHFALLRGVTWADYLRILRIRGDHSAPRITYCEGELEIMSPSWNHEYIKSLIGSLTESFCLEHGIDFNACGSWTLKDKTVERGAEPDGCYVFGRGPKGIVPRNARRPDLAIEVVWTWGRIDKLDVYRKLGVREIWYWRRGKMSVYELRGQKYASIKRSKVVPGIDLDLLLSFLDRPTTSAAIRDYRKALRK